MMYRTWSDAASWSPPTEVGRSGTHVTAMTLDSDNNVWVFYGTAGEVLLRVKKAGSERFEAPRCAVAIGPYENAGYPWLSAAASPERKEVGLLWVERPGEGYEVRFRSFRLDSFERDCPK